MNKLATRRKHKLKPNYNFEASKLVANHQTRSKHFCHTEIMAYCNFKKNTLPPDPLWAFTQMKKNYYQNKEDLIFKHYTNPSFFELIENEWGVSNRFINLFRDPLWASYVIHNDWFWKQIKAINTASWIRFLPGVKRVYLCGSVILEISKPERDLDLAVECYKYQLLLARFWVKIVFKITRLDTLTLLDNLKQLLFKFGLVSKQEIDKLDFKINKNKIECGLFFENNQQVNQYFGIYERQLFILSRAIVFHEYKDIKSFGYENEIVNSLFFLPQPKILVFIGYTCKFVLYLVSLFLLPLILFQLLWYWLKKIPSEDNFLQFRFANFYRRYF